MSASQHVSGRQQRWWGRVRVHESMPIHPRHPPGLLVPACLSQAPRKGLQQPAGPQNTRHLRHAARKTLQSDSDFERVWQRPEFWMKEFSWILTCWDQGSSKHLQFCFRKENLQQNDGDYHQKQIRPDKVLSGKVIERKQEHESKHECGLRRQTQFKIRGCVPAHGIIKLTTWQTLRDLKPRLSAINVIQLSIGSFRDVPCSACFDFLRRCCPSCCHGCSPGCLVQPL